MSVINQMLNDLEQRQPGSDGAAAAVYLAPARQQGWWILLLPLLCGLALGILGWRTWIYWQQAHVVAAASEVVGADTVVRVAAPVRLPEPVDAVGERSLPRHHDLADMADMAEAKVVANRVAEASDPVSGEPFATLAELDEPELTDEELQPELHAELAAEQQAIPRAPHTASVLTIETVELSAKELAALAERKATVAMAKGNLREARDNYYQVLAHDPYRQGAREQLAGLLYGEGLLTEAGQLLEEGVRLNPQQADFRLLLARLAISEGRQPQALGWLAGYQPDLASNMDYYATWAGLTQELGHSGDAAALYVKLLHQQPDQGRWWLGLGVAEDSQGYSTRALDAYRNALLHGNLGEASTNWLAQRIGQLTP